eukprot:TRINITY_DN3335_c0_g1_i1.p1 TRINITY_DN3335_c0_g1~~TRINITY_DN3335_c0_g1_i1.p1  ORF type:complete len:647 (-),score=89.42 TRINITY_DN3335_c0_g1_i1:196-2136(-)
MGSGLLLLVGLLLIGCLQRNVAGDIESDKQALLSFKNAVGRSLNWSESLSPCSWTGIRCQNNRVSELRLPAVGLIGQIPAGSLGALDGLTALSLRWNRLSGPVPSDLANCTQLRGLFLQDNQFSGPLPSFFSSWSNLVKLDLAFNRFSGSIPNSINSLTRLDTLYLQDNNLTGTLPALRLPSLGNFNVSNNDLTGSIPSSLSHFSQSAFLGNGLCGDPLPSCTDAPSPGPSLVEPASSSGNKLGAGAIAGIAVGAAVAFLLLLFCLIFLIKRKSKTSKSASHDLNTVSKGPEDIAEHASRGMPEDPNHKTEALSAAAAATAGDSGKGHAKKLVFFPGAQRTFDLEDLLRASAEVLGKGSVGTAYKAVLEFGQVVAVKRLKDVVIGQRDFVQQIEQVGKMNHQNLVPLRAYYYSKEEKLLVYDYMPMGSLSSLLHGNRGAGRTPLDWEARTRIALGAAIGIDYIHSKGPRMSHGNIKSSNILLTREYEARVSDVGLAQLVSTTSSANRIVGYRAPEVTDARKISQKADVYSFGVLLLELLTGKAPNHGSSNDDGVDLPRWVQSIVREEWTAEVFDVELLRNQEHEEEMVQLLQTAIDCVAPFPDQRPTISEVVRRIEAVRQNPGDSYGAVHESKPSDNSEIELGSIH